MTETNPWERQPKETHKAFLAFSIYRDLGPHDRTQVAVTHILFNKDALNNYKKTGNVAQLTTNNSATKRRKTASQGIRRWSADHSWVERATLYDAHLDHLMLEERNRAIKDMARRHANAGVIMINKAMEKLNALEGRNLSVSDATRLMELGLKTERLGRGEPEHLVGVVTGDPLEIQVQHTASPGLSVALRRIQALSAAKDDVIDVEAR